MFCRRQLGDLGGERSAHNHLSIVNLVKKNFSIVEVVVDRRAVRHRIRRRFRLKSKSPGVLPSRSALEFEADSKPDTHAPRLLAQKTFTFSVDISAEGSRLEVSLPPEDTRCCRRSTCAAVPLCVLFNCGKLPGTLTIHPRIETSPMNARKSFVMFFDSSEFGVSSRVSRKLVLSARNESHPEDHELQDSR